MDDYHFQIRLSYGEFDMAIMCGYRKIDELIFCSVSVTYSCLGSLEEISINLQRHRRRNDLSLFSYKSKIDNNSA